MNKNYESNLDPAGMRILVGFFSTFETLLFKIYANLKPYFSSVETILFKISRNYKTISFDR